MSIKENPTNQHLIHKNEQNGYQRSEYQLNEYQLQAVLDESEACLVNANVGSGKTTVLIEKILYLHEKKGVPYQDMVVLTFTNKAAGEIKERLYQKDNEIKEKELWGFGTFHSVALKMLKEKLPADQLGYTRQFQVITPEEEVSLAEEVISREKLKIKYKNRLRKRLDAAGKQCKKEDAKENRVSKYKDDIFILYELLEQEKKQQDKMSFDDLIDHAGKLLYTNPVYLSWVIIDEVQDSDEGQLVFVERLKTTGTHIFAVGDANQVIYSFRGSSQNVIYAFKHRFGANELSLPVNYRSSQTILEAARRFQQNAGELISSREAGSRIRIKHHYDPFLEAGYLADRIKNLHAAGIEYSNIAIFYRLKEQSKSLEEVFEKEEIPYQISVKKTLQEIPVLLWMFQVLRFSVNTRDIETGIAALTNKVYGERMTKKAAQKAIDDREGSELLTKMLLFSSQGSRLWNVEELFEYFNLDEYLCPTSSSWQKDKETVQFLFGGLISYSNEKEQDLCDGIRAYINSAALYGLDFLENDEKKDGVNLMTLHASKGLEFSHVFIIGVNQGLIPLQTKSFDDEEEERRLFFVGITRAKDELELSYYTNPGYYRAMPGESRYLKMLPEHLREDSKKDGAQTDLREMKKQIQQLKQESESGNIEKPDKRVRHERYGVGTILEEDDSKIVVDFDDFGKKEFIKGFVQLENMS
ncbi:MAG: ATP-dependent helicase [Clostridia bacterium]|nr:ATP-dependent helicase [Clostridia bacterium]NCC44637.1 ATP-dependent helicase [Clostridia bacterium]